MSNIFIIIGLSYLAGEALRMTSGNISVTLFDITVGVIVIVWYMRLALLGTLQKTLRQPFFKHLLLFSTIGLLGLVLHVTSLNSLELGTAVLYLIRLLVYYSLFPLVLSLSKERKKQLTVTMMVTGVCIVLIGFMQYFFYPNLRNLYYLGWDDHLYRLFSVFFDPNFAGAFFALLVLFYLFHTLAAAKVSTYKTVVFGLSSLLTLLALFLSYSRTAFLMLLVGLSIYLAALRYYKILIVSIVVCIILFFSFANTNIEGLNPFRTASTQARILSASHAVMIFAQHPLVGVGFNAYRYAQIQMGFRSEITRYPSHADAGTDNSFLFLLATTGLVGFLSFVYLWWKMVSGLKLRSPHTKALTFATLGSLFVGSLFTNLLFYPMLLAWVFTVLGCYSE